MSIGFLADVLHTHGIAAWLLRHASSEHPINDCVDEAPFVRW